MKKNTRKLMVRGEVLRSLQVLEDRELARARGAADGDAAALLIANPRTGVECPAAL